VSRHWFRNFDHQFDPRVAGLAAEERLGVRQMAYGRVPRERIPLLSAGRSRRRSLDQRNQPDCRLTGQKHEVMRHSNASSLGRS